MSIRASRSAGRSTCRSRPCCSPSPSGCRSARLMGLAPWGMLESNINQTTASAAAAITSSGLVAPIPALAMMTGGNLPWPTLAAWVFAVSFLGVWVGWYLRPRLIVQSNLVFPAGMATAETMRDMFSHGREAMKRVGVLMSSLTGAVLFNLIDDFVWQIPRFAPVAHGQEADARLRSLAAPARLRQHYRSARRARAAVRRAARLGRDRAGADRARHGRGRASRRELVPAAGRAGCSGPASP